MDKKELDNILREHLKWLKDEEDGERADLREANLRGTPYDGIDWLKWIGITPDEKGIA